MWHRQVNCIKPSPSVKRLIGQNQKLNSTVELLTIKFLILLDKSLHRRRSLNRDLFVPHLELLTIKFLILMDKSFHRRGRLNTVDLLVQSSLNQLLLVIYNYLPFYKTSHLSATYRTFSPKIKFLIHPVNLLFLSHTHFLFLSLSLVCERTRT